MICGMSDSDNVPPTAAILNRSANRKRVIAGSLSYHGHVFFGHILCRCVGLNVQRLIDWASPFGDCKVSRGVQSMILCSCVFTHKASGLPGETMYTGLARTIRTTAMSAAGGR